LLLKNISECNILFMCFTADNWYYDSSGKLLLCEDDDRFVAFASKLIGFCSSAKMLYIYVLFIY